ncbi:ETS-related transcription factor Elf-1 [Nothoprocta perdicaria]|uniref:E74 like ETS transcription factor 1 n=1 Tax=Nothoprocta perdicaria TaxID=30464 RepID=A0A8C7EE06_NOTPE|nr:ETS-related transcription factor Elf-1 [Nothoprocta perdicaria]XP_025890281.1 ETS-related transcription factor Elf-1 [Nothoprocta perdicaria]
MAAVVQQNELVFEFASNVMEDEQQLGDPSIFPAVIVEHVPSADLLHNYSGLTCVDEPSDMITESSLDVAEEQIIEDDDITLTVEASCHNGDETMETIEAAEALLNMDSPGPMLDEKRITTMFGATEDEDIVPPITHVSVTLDGIPEVVEVHQTPDPYAESPETPEYEQPKKKKGKKPKPPRPESPTTTPNISVKRKNKDGKGNTIYLWEFLLALLQDKATCPKYIKWTQREKGIFKLVDSKAVSRLWGKHKNKPDMNYETMGRALRYYYQRGILAKVEGQRLVYQFKEMPKDLVYIDDEDASPSTESSDSTLLSTPAANRNQSSRSRASANVGTKAGATPVSKAGSAKAARPKEPAEAARAQAPGVAPDGARTVQPPQAVFPTQLFRTVHVMQPLQALTEGHAAVTRSVPEETLNPSVQNMRTLQPPTQVPVVVSAGNPQLHTVTLQTVPLTTVIASTEPAAPAAPAKFILQAIPTSQPMAVLKENVLLPPRPPSPPAPLVLSPAQVQHVLGSGVQTVCNGAAEAAAAPSYGAAAPVVTFSPGGSQGTAPPPGAVITSVIKEAKLGAVKQEEQEEQEEEGGGAEQQPFVVVMSAPNGFPPSVQVKQESEPSEPSPYK